LKKSTATASHVQQALAYRDRNVPILAPPPCFFNYSFLILNGSGVAQIIWGIIWNQFLPCRLGIEKS
jgi:hypothetical protein